MKVVGLTGLPSPTLASAAPAEGPKRPNVVLIVADDLARDDCRAFAEIGVGEIPARPHEA